MFDSPRTTEQAPLASGGYLIELTTRIADGLGQLGGDWRARHASFVAGEQLADGGFPGRGAASDLYYTAFALRSLAVLGELNDTVAAAAGDFLRKRSQQRAQLIDLISLVFSARLIEGAIGDDPLGESDWHHKVVANLAELRRDDGGFAKAADGAASSTYYTFLVAATYELLGMPLPDADAVARFVLGQQREDGGFVEIRVMRRGGANPTAAAISLLGILARQTGKQYLTNDAAGKAANFLLSLVNEEGGYKANSQIPLADLLSTFTVVQTLLSLDRHSEVDCQALGAYIAGLKCDTGGFRAAAWDDVADVEYSFYGLAATGLLQQRL